MQINISIVLAPLVPHPASATVAGDGEEGWESPEMRKKAGPRRGVIEEAGPHRGDARESPGGSCGRQRRAPTCDRAYNRRKIGRQIC
jgi:hypothetical protein